MVKKHKITFDKIMRKPYIEDKEDLILAEDQDFDYMDIDEFDSYQTVKENTGWPTDDQNT